MDIRNISGNRIQSSDEGIQEQQKILQQSVDGQILDLIESAGSPSPENIGKTSQALTAGQSVMIPNEDSWKNMEQTSSMACGTTDLAMILTYYGMPTTPEDIDSAIRRVNYGAVPNDLIEYAHDRGLEAEGYNNSTVSELKSFIDQGYPVQVLIDPNDANELAKQHYVVVTGYGVDASGNEYINYHDPADGLEKQMPMAEFERKWADLWGGFNNYMIVYGPPGADLPAGRDDGIEATNALADGSMNVVNGWDRIFSADDFGCFVHGMFQLPGGVVQTLGSAVGFGIQWLGDGLNGLVEGIPVVENIVQPFGDILDAAGNAIGHLFGGFGEAVDSVGGAFESLFDGDVGGFFEGLGDAVGDVAGGVVDAVGDVIEGVGEAIGDFFSGW